MPSLTNGKTPPHPALPAHWYAAAIVQLTELRTCRCCHRAYRVPNKHLMIRLESVWPGGRRSLLRDRHIVAQTINTTDLPREKRTHCTFVGRCESCFTASPQDQLLLFPCVRPPKPSWQTILALMRARSAEEEEAREAKRKPRKVKPATKPSKIAEILARI